MQGFLAKVQLKLQSLAGSKQRTSCTALASEANLRRTSKSDLWLVRLGGSSSGLQSVGPTLLTAPSSCKPSVHQQADACKETEGGRQRWKLRCKLPMLTIGAHTPSNVQTFRTVGKLSQPNWLPHTQCPTVSAALSANLPWQHCCTGFPSRSTWSSSSRERRH